MAKKRVRPLVSHVAFHKYDDMGNVTESLTLGPKEARPDWVEEMLADGKHDHLYLEDDEDDDDDEVSTAAPNPDRHLGKKAKEPVQKAPTTEIVEGDAPPKGGPGSGRDAWEAYAKANGVVVGEDDNRDDIVAAVAAAGVPVG